MKRYIAVFLVITILMINVPFSFSTSEQVSLADLVEEMQSQGYDLSLLKDGQIYFLNPHVYEEQNRIVYSASSSYEDLRQTLPENQGSHNQDKNGAYRYLGYNASELIVANGLFIPDVTPYQGDLSSRNWITHSDAKKSWQDATEGIDSYMLNQEVQVSVDVGTDTILNILGGVTETVAKTYAIFQTEPGLIADGSIRMHHQPAGHSSLYWVLGIPSFDNHLNHTVTVDDVESYELTEGEDLEVTFHSSSEISINESTSNVKVKIGAVVRQFDVSYLLTNGDEEWRKNTENEVSNTTKTIDSSDSKTFTIPSSALEVGLNTFELRVDQTLYSTDLGSGSLNDSLMSSPDSIAFNVIVTSRDDITPVLRLGAEPNVLLKDADGDVELTFSANIFGSGVNPSAWKFYLDGDSVDTVVAGGTSASTSTSVEVDTSIVDTVSYSGRVDIYFNGVDYISANASCDVLVYEDTVPSTNTPPWGSINFPSVVEVGQTVVGMISVGDHEDHINQLSVEYNFPSSVVHTMDADGGSATFNAVGEQHLEMYIEDSGGKSFLAYDDVIVVEPKPYGVITSSGDEKIYRKIDIDLRDSYVMDSSNPIDWSKTEVDIQLMDSQSTNNIYTQVGLEGATNNLDVDGRNFFKIQCNEVGLVRVKAKIFNTRGAYDICYLDLNIGEDSAPELQVDHLNRLYRDPSNDNNASLDAYITLASSDGDAIGNLEIREIFDSNNDGTYDASSLLYSGIFKNSHEVINNHVGRYKLEVTATETYTSLSGVHAPKLSCSSSTFFEVDNVAPVATTDIDVVKDNFNLLYMNVNNYNTSVYLNNHFNNTLKPYFNNQYNISFSYHSTNTNGYLKENTHLFNINTSSNAPYYIGSISPATLPLAKVGYRNYLNLFSHHFVYERNQINGTTDGSPLSLTSPISMSNDWSVYQYINGQGKTYTNSRLSNIGDQVYSDFYVRRMTVKFDTSSKKSYIKVDNNAPIYLDTLIGSSDYPYWFYAVFDLETNEYLGIYDFQRIYDQLSDEVEERFGNSYLYNTINNMKKVLYIDKDYIYVNFYGGNGAYYIVQVSPSKNGTYDFNFISNLSMFTIGAVVEYNDRLLLRIVGDSDTDLTSDSLLVSYYDLESHSLVTVDESLVTSFDLTSLTHNYETEFSIVNYNQRTSLIYGYTENIFDGHNVKGHNGRSKTLRFQESAKTILNKDYYFSYDYSGNRRIEGSLYSYKWWNNLLTSVEQLPSYNTNQKNFVVFFLKDYEKLLGDSRYLEDLKAKLISKNLTPIFFDDHDEYLDQFSSIINDTDGSTITSLSSLNQVLASKLDTTTIMKDGVLYITKDSTLELSTLYFDYENDPMNDSRFEVNHVNPESFENSEGLSLLHEQVVPSNTSLDRVGLYHINARVQDKPSSNSAFSPYNKWSTNDNLIPIMLHRRPIAEGTISFTKSGSNYTVSFENSSYDLDHLSQANKGIAETSILWKEENDDVYQTSVPTSVPFGVYHLILRVKDVEGIWSHTYERTYELDETVPLQLLSADLKTVSEDFSVTNIPASEVLRYYNIQTRSANAHQLKLSLLSLVDVEVRTPRILSKTASDVRVGDDITWREFSLNVPSSLADGRYIARIEAFDLEQSVHKDFLVQVNTPIEITGSLSDDLTEVFATTNEYVDEVSVELYSETDHSVTLPLVYQRTVGGEKQWTASHTVLDTIPDGTYIAVFTASTPSDKEATFEFTYELSSLDIVGLSITGDWQRWDGQTDIFGNTLANMPHRFLSYEKVTVTVQIEGDPDQVYIRFSPLLEAMSFELDSVVYSYASDIGYTVDFPLNLTLNGQAYTVNYILPLAPSTLTTDDQRVHPSYTLTAYAVKGETIVTMSIDDIDITGNVYDHIFIEP